MYIETKTYLLSFSSTNQRSSSLISLYFSYESTHRWTVHSGHSTKNLITEITHPALPKKSDPLDPRAHNFPFPTPNETKIPVIRFEKPKWFLHGGGNPDAERASASFLHSIFNLKVKPRRFAAFCVITRTIIAAGRRDTEGNTSRTP